LGETVALLELPAQTERTVPQQQEQMASLAVAEGLCALLTNQYLAQ
jgi:hypothetical protein